MMTIFSIAELMDEEKTYQAEVMEIVQRRAWALIEGLGVELKPNPLFSYYYGIVDFEFWIKKYVGPEVMQFIKKHYHPLDIVFRLAEDHSIVLLNGGGFSAPDWSARVSFANLDDEVYGRIGRALRRCPHLCRSLSLRKKLRRASPAHSRARRRESGKINQTIGIL